MLLGYQVDMGGNYVTKSTVVNTFAAGDPDCILEVDSLTGDRYFAMTGNFQTVALALR